MEIDYQKHIWGQGTAQNKWTNPSNVRFRRILDALSDLPDSSKILEVGCGAGSFIRALKMERSGLDCFGTDVSEQAIAAARADAGVEYLVCAEDSLPYSDGYFDAVFFTDVLEHVRDPRKFLSEINRVLKPCGLLYGYVPCEGDSTSFWNKLEKAGLKNDLTRKYAGHINFFDRKEVSKMFKDSGFEITGVSYSEHFIGQLAGLGVFYSLDRAVKKGGQSFNNEEYARQVAGKRGRAFGFLRSLINWLITLESEFLRSMPSPNMHITAVKK